MCPASRPSFSTVVCVFRPAFIVCVPVCVSGDKVLLNMFAEGPPGENGALTHEGPEPRRPHTRHNRGGKHRRHSPRCVRKHTTHTNREAENLSPRRPEGSEGPLILKQEVGGVTEAYSPQPATDGGMKSR